MSDELLFTPALKFQFTHPGRGATGLTNTLLASATVSIHAPREGCDTLYHSNTDQSR